MKHVDVQGFLVELLYLTGFIENALMAELQRCVGMQYEKVPWAHALCFVLQVKLYNRRNDEILRFSHEEVRKCHIFGTSKSFSCPSDPTSR